jgi:hypothetical protein
MWRLKEKLLELGYRYNGKSYNNQSNNFRKEIDNCVLYICLDYKNKYIKDYYTILHNIKNKNDIPFIEKVINQLQKDLEVLREC